MCKLSRNNADGTCNEDRGEREIGNIDGMQSGLVKGERTTEVIWIVKQIQEKCPTAQQPE